MAGKKSRAVLTKLLTESGFDFNKIRYLGYSTLVDINNNPWREGYQKYRLSQGEEQEGNGLIILAPGGQEQKQDTPQDTPKDKAGEALTDIIMPHLNTKVALITKTAILNAKSDLTTIVKEELAKNVTRIEIKQEGLEQQREINGAHKQTADLIKMVAAGIPVYTYGAPGGGKSTAARQVAEALDLEFYYFAFSSQTTSARLIGYMDAKGEIVKTPTTESYKKGGLILFDEVDKGGPSVLAELHGMLANGKGSFPDGIFSMHKDWRVICAANTPGNGATIGHESSTKMDIAFRDRFVFLEWEYDTALESKVARAYFDDEQTDKFVSWVHQVRKGIADRKGAWKLVASPRVSFSGAQLLAIGYTMNEAAEMSLFKGADNELKQAVLSSFPLPR